MELAYHAANVLSILLFLVYGGLCLFADGMVEEFERFGLARYRRLTGSLEVLGALGLAGGYLVPEFTLISGAGLATLMLLGVGVRVRVGDPLFEILPAAFLLLVNGWIVVAALQRVG